MTCFLLSSCKTFWSEGFLHVFFDLEVWSGSQLEFLLNLLAREGLDRRAALGAAVEGEVYPGFNLL